MRYYNCIRDGCVPQEWHTITMIIVFVLLLVVIVGFDWCNFPNDHLIVWVPTLLWLALFFILEGVYGVITVLGLVFLFILIINLLSFLFGKNYKINIGP